jgi:hypothetical protein
MTVHRRWSVSPAGAATEDDLSRSSNQETSLMIVITAVSIVIGLVFVAAVAFVAGRVEIESSPTWSLGSIFVSPPLPDRPRGVQEEDLPRFVFRTEAAGTGAR